MKSARPARVALLLGSHRSGGQTRSEAIRLTSPDCIYYFSSFLSPRVSISLRETFEDRKSFEENCSLPRKRIFS